MSLAAPNGTVRLDRPFVLDSGRVLPELEIAYESWGVLSPERDNVVLICHSLTKGAHAAGNAAAGERPGWWDAAIGPGRTIDTRRWFVVCTGAIGGSFGSSGPRARDPVSGRPYATRFPVVTVRDIVRAQRRFLDALGIGEVAAVIGGCLGGAQALEWAICYPEQVRGAIAISTTAATSAHTNAIFAVMARLIRQDPAWNGGDYDGAPPVHGLANALAVALPLWMDREAMEARFARRLRAGTAYRYSLEPEFAVEAFIDEVAERGAASLDANGLLYLMRATQYFDLEREYGDLVSAVRRVRARVLLLSYESDWRYPPHEVQRLQDALTAAGVRARHAVLRSRFGHGAFLHDLAGCAPEISTFLDGCDAATRAPAIVAHA